MKPPSPQPPLHIPQNSKRKRVFMDLDDDLFELPPPGPAAAVSSSTKLKQQIMPEIIDLDDYEEEPVVIVPKDKGKAIAYHGAIGLSQPKDLSSNNFNSAAPFGKKSNFPTSTAYSGNLFQDPIDDTMDHYAMMQEHFDSMDLPAGIEANIPWYDADADADAGYLIPPSTNQTWQSPAVNYGGGNLYPSMVTSQTAYNGVTYPYQPLKTTRSISRKANLSFGGGSSNRGGFYRMTVDRLAFSLDIPPTYPPQAQLQTSLLGQAVQIDAAAPVHNSANDISINLSNVKEDEILKKFKAFKQFDTAEGHSDHHYAAKGSSKKHPSKKWAKAIQDEWRILEKDLPDTIFVRVYETRMDILRAVIIGAEGTPYHDGLFFFDIFFPDSYPSVPPHFEDLVVGHFYGRAHDILVACKAYMEGAQVGCLVKGGVQDLESGDKSCSNNFKISLKGPVNLLVEAFSKIGVKDCRKIITPEIEVRKCVTLPMASNHKAKSTILEAARVVEAARDRLSLTWKNVTQ
ncbi:hypothetical protein ACFE04_024040 [Oxalis oulophora]